MCVCPTYQSYKIKIRFKFISIQYSTLTLCLTHFQVFWIASTAYSTESKSTSIKKYASNNEHQITTKFNDILNETMSQTRDRRELPAEFTIIKHKSRPSKRYPGYRSRRRPKPVYGPPNYTYGSPISDYTLGYTSKGKKTKNSATSPFSSSILDTSSYESEYVSPPKLNLYSGHNSYESTFKNSNAYVAPSAFLPTHPLENYGSEAPLSYTPPPTNAYSNQGYKSFGEPPQQPKVHDLTGSGTHSVKSIPPSTNYGVPVAPIQTNYKSQQQNGQSSINQQQDTYISNLHSSFSTPTLAPSPQLYNLPNLQTIYTNPGIYTNTGINTNPSINSYSPINTNPGTNVADPSTTNVLTKFNQNALNTLTFNSYASPQPPQVKYNPGSVTITSSKEITQARQPLSGKFAEPPRNYKNPYQTPITSYEAPIQHDSTKTTYNIDAPENQFEPTIYRPPQHFWNESVKTTTQRNKYLPPVLPTAYDQNQFNNFANENQHSNNYNDQSDFLDSDGDYSNLFDVSHEFKKIPKTKLTKTYAGTNLKSADSSIESVEVPSDEYVDELISAPTTKKPRTRRRRPRPTAVSTTPHILDTEDLRDAFSSGSVRYSLSVNPNENGAKNAVRAQSKIAKDKNFVLISSANNRTGNKQYPSRYQSSFDPINDVKEFLQTDLDSAGKSNTSNRGIEILSIQQSKSHSYYAGTVAPPPLFKQKGINARYDQPKYDDSMFNVVSTNVRMANKSTNLKLATGATGSRRTKKQNFNDKEEKIGDDLTTAKEIDPIFWNGLRLPENHKLAKRIA